MRTATVFLSGITSTAFPNIKAQVTQSTKADMEELDEAIRLDREMNGKKPLKARKELNEQKEIKVSMTDPDCGYMVQNGKPEGSFYLDHRTVDHKYNIITDVHITPGNVHDAVSRWIPVTLPRISARNFMRKSFSPSLDQSLAFMNTFMNALKRMPRETGLCQQSELPVRAAYT